MFGNVTTLEGSHVNGKYRDEKHAAHMRHACGLGPSQSWLDVRVTCTRFPAALASYLQFTTGMPR